jgi:glycosyltransferase involved in cell wall biosynthesis
MKIAFFSPLPPVRSGIADYSEALLSALRPLAEVEVFTELPARFDPAAFDALLYQMGNNVYHDFTYEMALRHPGIVVMHEGNLHHLICDRTIKKNDWDGYLREAEHEGGAEALAFARRVRALEVGPDYDGLPMLRRLLEFTRALIVHSDFVAGQCRAAGFAGPIARIPHGAWMPEEEGVVAQADRLGTRQKLGLAPDAPLIGVFGFLKPYKRIAESLRALRRLRRLRPDVRMILVGEPHPDLKLDHLLATLELGDAVRVLGFTPISEFVHLMAACDVVLNLRYPTVGESSGTLLRSLGLGKPVLVSDIGSFREFPDDICLKVPVNEMEEDLLFEYLNLLVSRPSLARGMGERARAWVRRECRWEVAARRYLEFCQSVAAQAETHARR